MRHKTEAECGYGKYILGILVTVRVEGNPIRSAEVAKKKKNIGCYLQLYRKPDGDLDSL